MSVSSDLETLELVLIGSLLVCYSGSIDGKQSDITIKKVYQLRRLFDTNTKFFQSKI